MAIKTRQTDGTGVTNNDAPLTNAEVDNNFIELVAVDATKLANVVEDTTPQLGGNLDLNSSDITGTGNIDVTGTVTSDGLAVAGAAITDSNFAVYDTDVGSSDFYFLNTNATANNSATVYLGPANSVAGAYIKAIAESDFTTAANRDGALALGTRSNGTFIDSLYITSDGNVSIPSGNLDVTGTVTADGLAVSSDVTFTDASPNIYLIETDTTDLNTALGGNAGTFKILTRNDSNTNIGTRFAVDHSTGDISFYEDTGTTAKLFWDASAESLGIGIAPAHKLSIFGTGAGNATVQIEGEGGADPYINFLTNNAQHWSLGVDDSDSDKFKLSEHSALGTNDYFVVDVTGNVGIGVVPNSSWHSTLTALQIGGNASLSAQSAVGASKQAYFSQNVFNDGDQKYISTDQASNYLQQNGTHVFQVASSGSANAVISWNTAVTIDNSGNVGIGVTPSAMSSTYDSLQVGSVGTVFSHDTATGDGSTFFGSNVYNNSGWKYITTNEASFIQQKNGAFSFATANSGAADSTISFSYPMTLDSSGNLLHGSDMTSFSSSNEGVILSNGTGLYSTRDGGIAIYGKRLNSDGAVINIAKDTTTVGQIGTNGSAPYFATAVGSTLCGIKAQGGSTPRISPTDGSGAVSNGVTNLGATDARWKDLFIGNDIGHLDAAGTARILYDRSTNILGNGGTNGSFSALSKGSGSFKIDHPLEAKTDTHHLVHSFVESPTADNIYRGKIALVSGSATVNIDAVAGMTDGTFTALNREVQCFTSNESGWTAVKGLVSGNTLTITAQENTCTDTVSWLVVGERQDPHMYATDWTDENGKVIVEPLKPVIEEIEEETP